MNSFLLDPPLSQLALLALSKSLSLGHEQPAHRSVGRVVQNAP